MANVIKNLLVGIGFDYDKRGQREVESGIDSVSSKALQLGTVVAGAFGAKALTVGFADSRDALGKFSATLGVTADDVSALGNAVEREGGSLESYMSQLEGIENLRAGLLVGDAEFISIAGKAGIDTTDLIAASDATEAYLSLADQFQGMNQQQRLNAASALGLDDASIRLLSRGREGVEGIVEAQRKMRPVTQSMIETSRQFNIQMHDLGQNIGGVTDKISDALLPEIVEITEGVNGWFEANDKLINQRLDVVLDPLAENFTAVATAGGLLATSGVLGTFAGLAKHIPIAGAGLAGIATSLGTITKLGGVAAAGYAVGSVIEQNLDDETRDDIGRTTARVLAALGNEEAKTALDTEREQLESQGLEQPGLPLWDWDSDEASSALGADLPEWLFTPLDELIFGDNLPEYKEGDVRLNDDDVPTYEPPRPRIILDDGDVPVYEPTQGELSPYEPMNVPVEPTQGELSPYEPMNVPVNATQGELSPYEPMNVPVNATQGELSPYEPVSAELSPQPVDVSRERVELPVQPVQQPTRVNNDRPIRVEASLNLDGNVIDRRIIDVTERQNQQAIDDLSSNVRG